MRMKFHHQKGISARRQLSRALWIAIPGLIACAGVYTLATALSPALVSLPLTDNQQAVEQKLAAAPKPTENRLYIPQINVDVAIVEGADESVLELGSWHRQPQNGNPERGGNFVLSAHRFSMGWTPEQTRAKSPFYNIDRLALGDQFFVDYNGNRYAYKITRKYEVPPTAVEIENASEKPKLTLYSCTLQGANDGRDVIEAEPLGRVDRVEPVSS